MARSFVGRWWRPGLTLVWSVVVGLLTLTPDSGSIPRIEEIPSGCVWCGSRGTADALLNILLFLPLGVAVGGLRRGLPKAVAAGLLCSLAIELIQTALPGRHATASDLLWNASGAGVGVGLYWLIRWRISRVDAEPGRSGAPAWGLLLGVGFVAGGILLIPSPTRDDYWGQWTPGLGSMPQYDGEVLRARLDEVPLPSRQIEHSGPDASLLEGNWTLEGIFVVGTPPPSVSPILSVYDGHQREILLLGAHRDDLVFRERNLARRLRFDSPDLRIVDAFAGLSPGDTSVIGGRRVGSRLCLRLGEREECGVGVTPARTWGLLLYVEGPGPWLRTMVDAGWLAVLFFPLGFLGRTWGNVALGTVTAFSGMALAAAVTPLIVGPWIQIVACLVGVVLGRVAVGLLVGELRTQPSSSISLNV